MKNQKSFSELVGSLEAISEDQHGMLMGGFVTVAGANSLAAESDNVLLCKPTNNCNGGNCVEGCGKTA